MTNPLYEFPMKGNKYDPTTVERWRVLPGGFSISSYGSVRNDRTERIVAPRPLGGHLVAQWYIRGELKTFLVAELVLVHFGNKPKPEGGEPYYKDRDPKNCRLENLRWAVQNPSVQKTHCPRNHPYSGDNVYVNPSTGARSCRRCKSARQKDSADRRNRRRRARAAELRRDAG